MSRLSGAKTVVDPEMINKIIVRNGLSPLGKSEQIFGGPCPLCGHIGSFVVWADKAIYRCFYCGCDGRFVTTPERYAEQRTALRAKLSMSEEIS